MKRKLSVTSHSVLGNVVRIDKAWVTFTPNYKTMHSLIQSTRDDSSSKLDNAHHAINNLNVQPINMCKQPAHPMSLPSTIVDPDTTLIYSRHQNPTRSARRTSNTIEPAGDSKAQPHASDS